MIVGMYQYMCVQIISWLVINEALPDTAEWQTGVSQYIRPTCINISLRSQMPGSFEDGSKVEAMDGSVLTWMHVIIKQFLPLEGVLQYVSQKRCPAPV